MLTSGLVRACLNVLRCVAEGFPQGRFAALLDTDYFRAGGPSLARTLREVGFVAESARPLAECVAATAARATDDPAARASGRATLAARGEECARVMAVLRPLEGRRTVAAHVRTFRRALGALGLRPVLQDDRALTAARRDVRARVRFEETLTVVRALLAGERVTHRGRYYTFAEASISPLPRVSVEIWLGGTVRAASRTHAPSAARSAEPASSAGFRT